MSRPPIEEYSAGVKRLLLEATRQAGVTLESLDNLLDAATEVSKPLTEIMDKFVEVMRFDTVPEEFQEPVRELCRGLVFSGFLVHCVLFTNSHRQSVSQIDLLDLASQWNVESLTANSLVIGQYNTDSAGVPLAVFDLGYSAVDDLQRRMGLGWFKRRRNKSKFLNFFASGIVLGLIVDVKTAEVAR